MPPKTTIYWDCTFLSAYPNRNTGIERVIRELGNAIAEEIRSNQESQYNFRPCISDKNGHVYALTKIPELGKTIELSTTKPQTFSPNDIYITDASWDKAPLARLGRHWRQGLILGVIQHDVIPLTHPETTTEQMVSAFTDWMLECAQFADFYACNSRSTKSELMTSLSWLAPWRTIDENQVFSFGLGTNLSKSQSATSKERATTSTSPSFLMVGTVEPRKQYGLVLDAFENLWRKYPLARLTIIGAAGWNTKSTQQRIENLEDSGRAITWKRNATDEELSELYSNSTALIMASKQEGFGLPIIEALAHGTPILASDIDVFHEVGTPYALWFSPKEPKSLESLLESILDGIIKLPVVSTDYRPPTWKDAAKNFLTGLEQTAYVRSDLRQMYDARVAGLKVTSGLDTLALNPPTDLANYQNNKGAYSTRVLKNTYRKLKSHRYGGYPIRLANALLKSSFTRHEVFRVAQRVDHLTAVHNSLELELSRLGRQITEISNELDFFETRITSLLALEREHTQNRLSSIEEVIYENISKSATSPPQPEDSV